MNQVERRGKVGYEDLMRKLEEFEKELLPENRGMAMDLMVLEAQIRERFQHMEARMWDQYNQVDFDAKDPMDLDLSMADLQAMIPQDLPLFPSVQDLKDSRKRKKTIQTIGMAALLAVATAIGVFGLASILQVTLSWIA